MFGLSMRPNLQVKPRLVTVAYQGPMVYQMLAISNKNACRLVFWKKCAFPHDKSLVFWLCSCCVFALA